MAFNMEKYLVKEETFLYTAKDAYFLNENENSRKVYEIIWFNVFM